MYKEYGMVKHILVYGTDSDTFKFWMDITDTKTQKDINSFQVVEAVLNTFVNYLHKNVPIVCFLMGNSSASEFYMPTFQNTLSGPSS